MNEQTGNSKSWIVYALLFAVAVVTVAASLLLTPAYDRDAKFCLSLAMVVLAEAVVFLLPAVSRKCIAEGAAPWRFAQYAIGIVFALAILGIAALTGPEGELNGLIVAYLIAGIALALGIGLTQLAAGHTQINRDAYCARKVWLADWRARFEDLADRLSAMPDDGQGGVKTLTQAIRDDIRYADRESLPGSETIEAELDAALNDIAQIAAAGLLAGDIAKDVEGRLQGLRTGLRRRGEKMKALRAD